MIDFRIGFLCRSNSAAQLLIGVRGAKKCDSTNGSIIGKHTSLHVEAEASIAVIRAVLSAV
jgi:hypothetical protein